MDENRIFAALPAALLTSTDFAFGRTMCGCGHECSIEYVPEFLPITELSYDEN